MWLPVLLLPVWTCCAGVGFTCAGIRRPPSLWPGWLRRVGRPASSMPVLSVAACEPSGLGEGPPVRSCQVRPAGRISSR